MQLSLFSFSGFGNIKDFASFIDQLAVILNILSDDYCLCIGNEFAMAVIENHVSVITFFWGERVLFSLSR